MSHLSISMRKFISMWALQVIFTVLLVLDILSDGGYVTLTGIVWSAWLGEAVLNKMIEARHDKPDTK